MNNESTSGYSSPVIASACGVAAWPIASLFKGGLIGWLHGPEKTILPMILAGSLAGFCVGMVTAERTALRQKPFAAAATRAGFMAVVIAATLLVVRATCLYAESGHVAWEALAALFIAVVAILPATLFAMFMGGVGRALRLAFAADPESARPAFSFRPIHGLYVGCALALVSPVMPAFFGSSGPTFNTLPANAITPPPPSSFAYQKPEGFATASASCVTVVATKSLPDVDTTKPILISPDGQRLAFHREGNSSSALIVFDLDTFSETSRVEFGAPATSLAWSPDSARLAGIFQTDDARYIGIVTPDQRRVINLPRPESRNIPSGTISWPDAAEVVLHPSSGKALALNLDNLELRPLEEATFFKALNDTRKDRIKDASSPSLPKTTKSSLALDWTLKTAGPRLIAGDFFFKAFGGPGIVATDNERGIRHHLREFALDMDSRVIFAPDGSKGLVIQGRNVFVQYLGLRDAPNVIRRLDMKRKLDDFSQAENLKKALSEKRLCAFVYLPLTNPLTNSVVGAEYGSLKALVRFISWTGTNAEVWVQDEFLPIAPGDVVSALHTWTWEDREPKSLADGAASAWWTTIGDGGDTKLDSIPLAKDTPALDIGPRLEMRWKDNEFTLNTVRESHASPAPVKSLQLDPPAPPPPPSTSLDRLSRTLIEPKPVSFNGRDVIAFINAHHQKSSNANIDGLLNDYARQVQHFKVGMVDQAFIRAEEVKYREGGQRVSEKVRGAIRLTGIGSTRVQAQYELQFMRVSPDANWIRGVTDVTLEIDALPEGMRIVKQDATPRENEKQKGRGNPPAF